MADTKGKDVRRPVHITPDTHRRLRVYAAHNDVSMSLVAEKAVKSYLKRIARKGKSEAEATETAAG